jgi:hypothetical protein
VKVYLGGMGRLGGMGGLGVAIFSKKGFKIFINREKKY